MRPDHASTTTSLPTAGAIHPLDELIAEIAKLQQAVVEELRSRRASLSRDLSSVDAELAELTGEPATEENAASASSPSKRNVTLPELIAELKAAPKKTLNIRKAHLDVKSIKALVKAHPQMLALGGKTGWPTVTLQARTEPESSGRKTGDPHPDLFSGAPGE